MLSIAQGNYRSEWGRLQVYVSPLSKKSVCVCVCGAVTEEEVVVFREGGGRGHRVTWLWRRVHLLQHLFGECLGNSNTFSNCDNEGRYTGRDRPRGQPHGLLQPLHPPSS